MWSPSNHDAPAVFYSYALVTASEALLFVDQSKLPPDVDTHLADSVTIRQYDWVVSDLKARAAHLAGT